MILNMIAFKKRVIECIDFHFESHLNVENNIFMKWIVLVTREN